MEKLQDLLLDWHYGVLVRASAVCEFQVTTRWNENNWVYFFCSIKGSWNDANFCNRRVFGKLFRSAKTLKLLRQVSKRVASPHIVCISLCVPYSFALNSKDSLVAFLITFHALFNKFAFTFCYIIVARGGPDTREINCQFNSFALFFFILTSN